MKTLSVIVITLWIFFFTAVVIAVVNKWDNIWIALPIIGVIVLSVLYSEIYKENRLPKEYKCDHKWEHNFNDTIYTMRCTKCNESSSSKWIDKDELDKRMWESMQNAIGLEFLKDIDFTLMNNEPKEKN